MRKRSQYLLVGISIFILSYLVCSPLIAQQRKGMEAIEIDAASLETELSAIWEIAVSFEISDENGNLICKPEIKLQDPSQSPITSA